MSDIPKVPPSQVPGQPTPRPGTEPNAQVSKLPIELVTLRQALQLRGEVIRAETDARTQETVVRIKTPEGEIEVRLPENETPPKQGERVNVEIQPGRPPTEASVRPERAPPADRSQTPQEPAPTPRPSQTPVEVVVRPPSERPPSQPTQPSQPPQQTPDMPWPQEGSVVRLQPLTPKEVAAIIEEFPELVSSAAPQVVEFKAQVIAAEAQETILTETLNIRTETIDAPKQIIIQEQGGVAPKEQILLAILSAPTPQTPATNIQITPPVIASQKPILPTAQINVLPLKPDALSPATPLPITAAAQPAPAAALITNTPEIILRPHSMDVKIDSIIPPKPEFIVPGQKPQAVQAALEAISKEPAIVQNQKAGSLTGVITGLTPDLKLPVLTVVLPQVNSGQSFALQAPSETLIPGTQIQVTPQALHVAPSQITSAALPLLPSQFLTPGPWPVMEEIFQTLAHIAPPAAQAMSALTPSPASPQQMTPAALFFIAAARGGDITSWLGDKTIDILRSNGKSGILSRLTQEGGLLSRLGAEPVSQEWRGMSLPMFWQNEFHKITLYYKQDKQANDNDNTQGKSTRFVFDLNLSHMGKVQIDGLFKGTRLDLILRTEQHFSQNVQMDMRATFAKALKEAQCTGELSFQNNPHQWVTIKAGKESFGISA
jgi:hypothetical protein